MPVLLFKPEQELCPVDGNRLKVLKTKTRTIKATGIGTFIAHHTFLYCPEHSHLGPWQSTDLSKIVPPDSSVAYSVIVEVGKLRFLENRQVAEIQLILLERHDIELSISELERLINRFIFYLAAVHQKNNGFIREYIKTQGGYILHLDATCEGDSPKLVLSLDSVSGFVLYSAKVKTENKDDLVGFLKEIKKRFGSPHAVGSDMGKGIEAAVKDVFGDIPHFICHFHFLKAIGLMLFEKEHIAVRNALSKAAVSGKLKTMRRKMGKQFGEISIDEIENFLMQPEKFGKAPVASELSTYYLILWILDHAAQGDGYGFPFDQRYLNFYERLKAAYIMIKEVTTFYSRKTKNDKIIWKLYHSIKGVAEDSSLREIADQYREKLAVFSDLREAFGTAPKSVNNGLTQMKETASNGEHQKIKKAVQKFLKQIEKTIGKTKDEQLCDSFNKVISKINEYGERLFADPLVIEVNGEKKLLFMHRTNNILEHRFRGFNYGFRRIHGNHSVRRNLENIPEQLPLIENLKNPNYVKLIFGNETNIAEKFAEVDVKLIRGMEKKHCRKKKIYSSRKIRCSLRSSDFKEKLLWAFQAAAT